MTVPYYVNERQSDIRAIKPGWYGLERNGKLSFGPFSTQGNCLTGITHARSNFRASPWWQTRQMDVQPADLGSPWRQIRQLDVQPAD